MADNRKYYYLKLKENFFDSDYIVLLEDMKDGICKPRASVRKQLSETKQAAIPKKAAARNKQHEMEV